MFLNFVDKRIKHSNCLYIKLGSERYSYNFNQRLFLYTEKQKIRLMPILTARNTERLIDSELPMRFRPNMSKDRKLTSHVSKSNNFLYEHYVPTPCFIVSR